MLSFCCLCGSKKNTVSNFDVEEKTADVRLPTCVWETAANLHPLQIAKVGSDGALAKTSLGKPTENEYTVELGITLLDAFVEVSREIPVPGLPDIVKVAVSLVKACQVSYYLLKHDSILIQMRLGKPCDVGKGERAEGSNYKACDDSG